MGASLLGIESHRVRNLVRGLLAASSAEAYVATMESLHRECGPEDAAAVGRIIHADPRAKFGGPTPPFMDSPDAGSDRPFYIATRLDLELAAQAPRFVGQERQLIEALKLLAEINDAMLSSDADRLTSLLADYHNRHGTSVIVAMKAISLRHSIGHAAGVSVDDDVILTPYLRPRRQVTIAALEDTCDDTRDYMRARRFFMKFAAQAHASKAEASIVGELLSPLASLPHCLPIRIEAFGRLGLVDLTAFLFRTGVLLRHQGRHEDALAVETVVPEQVRAAWRETFADAPTERLRTMVGSRDQFDDLAFFSHLPAWSEYQAFMEHRLDVEQAVGSRLDHLEKGVLQRGTPMFRPSTAVTEIATGSLERVIEGRKAIVSGGFARTVALIGSIEAGSLAVPDGEALSLLLDRTINVATLVSTEEIDDLLPRRGDDHLYEYMRTALLFDAEGGSQRNHALRRATQDLVQRRYDGDLLAFIEDVDTDDGHVSRHLYHLCSETFLTNLFGLFKQADDVMEAQTRLLEWQGGRRDDENAVLQAKSLRLLIRLRKVRGSIDETRIYVDPLRVMEWIHENQEDELRALQPFAEEILAASDVGFNSRDLLTNSVQPRSRLKRLIDKSYAEFCTNKVHGAASYVGRRVRHGTFHGHLSVEMQPTVEAAAEEFRSTAPAYAAFLRRWMRDFDRAVLSFAAERLHVRSKSTPKGLIVPTLDDPDKALAGSAAVLGIATALREKLQISQVVAIVLDYCWLLVDVDLKRARDAIEELRREFIMEVEQYLTGTPEIDARVTDCVRQLNVAVAQRFEIAKSWLTRTTNFSPRASVALMVEAVLDEVRQRYEFRPEVELPEDLGIDLIGHRFHFFYDALYILVVNAAKYGRSDGGLGVTVRAELSQEGHHVDLSVTITSCFVPEERAEHVREIDVAMSAEVGDAMNRDGRTGLRKLRGLAAEADEILSFDCVLEEDRVRFVLRMRYPLS